MAAQEGGRSCIQERHLLSEKLLLRVFETSQKRLSWTIGQESHEQQHGIFVGSPGLRACFNFFGDLRNIRNLRGPVGLLRVDQVCFMVSRGSDGCISHPDPPWFIGHSGPVGSLTGPSQARPHSLSRRLPGGLSEPLRGREMPLSDGPPSRLFVADAGPLG